MSSLELQSDRAYWRQRLAGSPPLLALATDRPRPAAPSMRCASLRAPLSAELHERVLTMARQEGTTPFVPLVAAFTALLRHYTGQEDLPVGSGVASRLRREAEGLLGMFANMVVLRTDLSGDPTFRQLLARVRATTLEAFEHQELPFQDVVEALQIERNAGIHPVFQVAFSFHDAPLSTIPPGNRSTQLDLDVIAIRHVDPHRESGQGLTLVWEYSTDLFDAATMEQMAAHYARLLEQCVAHPEQRISALSPVGDEERHRLVVDYNATREAFAHDTCIHEWVAAQAARTPDALAASGAGHELTYRELDEQANRLAHHLRALGVGPEVPVGICLERTPRLLVALLGVLKAGGAYVPMEPAFPAERQRRMLEDARAPWVITQASLVDKLSSGPARPVVLDTLRLEELPSEPPATGVGPRNLAYVLFTSGSTGRPKGTQVEHRALMNCVHWTRRVMRLEPGQNTCHLAGQSFDVSVLELWMGLSSGACVHLPPEEIRASAIELQAWMLERAIHAAVLATPVGEALLALDWPRRTLLHTLLVGGARLHAPPRAEIPFTLVNGYGLTETTVAVTTAVIPPGDAGGRPPPLGKPLPNTRLYVLDEGMELVGHGVPGELYVGGECVARGYAHRPDLTAERYVPSPFGESPGERLYRTGDIVRWGSDGQLEFLGRRDGQVKLRGFRIELEEISAVLAQHPQVRQAFARLVPRTRGDGWIVGYVVPRDGGVEPEALQAYLAEQLPDYMVPARILVLDALPLTSSGKVDTAALPLPESPATGASLASLDPRSPIERELASLWSELLGLEQLGPDDDVYLLGAHSLLISQAQARIRERFRVKVPLARLFEASTVAAQARIIEATQPPARALPLARVPRTEPLPLSFPQEQLWLLHELNPTSRAYNAQALLWIRGELDERVLEACLDEIVRRHEVLRTTFRAPTGRPLQYIHPPWKVSLPRVDLRALPAAERAAALMRLQQEELTRTFDVGELPLVHLLLVRMAEREWALLHVEHHFVHDGWSYSNFVFELLSLYRELSRGRPSPLAELPVQYADFAAWQRQWIHTEEADRQREYWRRRLAGSPPLLALATDHPRPAIQSMQGTSLRVPLGAELYEQIRAVARQEGTTPFVPLLAAFTALLHHYTGQDDLPVGSFVANRRWRELEGLLGMFVNVVVLRTDVSGDPTFRQLLAQVRATTLEAFEHQDLPFLHVVEALQPERNVGFNPLFQVAFSFHDTHLPAMDPPGLRVELQESLSNGSAKFDLNVVVIPHVGQRRREDGEGLTLVWEYSTDLFDAATMEQMAAHYARLLERCVAHPERRISALSPVGDEERRQLLQWNNTAEPLPEHGLHELFERQAAATPLATAVVFGAHTLSYAELNAQANRLAHFLRAQGAGPESLVAVCLERSHEVIVALLAILKAGAAYVPLDPSYPRERLAFMLQDTGARVVLSEQRFADLLQGTHAQLVLLDRDRERVAAHPDHNPQPLASPDHLAYVIYTSGSTGRPKGVMVPRGALTNLLCSMCRLPGVRDGDVLVAVTTVLFDIAALELFAPLLAGATVVMADRHQVRDPQQLMALLAASRATLLQATPTAWRMLLDAGYQPPPDFTVLCGGEKMPPDLAARLSGSGARVWDLYGPTETTVWSSVARLQEGRVTHFAPVANTTLHVLDPALEPAPFGVAGELYIGGLGLARGYRGRPDLTAERFLPDPHATAPGQRLYRTGDLARRHADGHIEILGRTDHQLKIRGYRIEPAEIEAALAAHPDVATALVHPTPTPHGDRQLTAYLLLKAHRRPEGAELRSFLSRTLPDYMLPSAFMVLDAFPLTPNGKVDRKALPLPEEARSELQGEYVGPRNPTEELLATLWCDVLGLDRASIHDNFFKAGGHSLLATRLAARLRQAFGAEVPLRLVFEAPTVAGLAAALAAARPASTAAPIAPTDRNQPLPLSFAQERLWFLDQLQPGSTEYLVPVALRLRGGELDPAVLQRALEAVVERHEVLRTRYEAVDGVPHQVIDAPAPVPLSVVDLGQVDAGQQAHALRALQNAELRKPFDLAQGPLLRATLVRLATTEHVLLVSMHHIVSDAWSLAVLGRELSALYGAFAAGQPSPLAPLAVQYADFAAWQRQWLTGAVLDTQLGYWRTQLAGLEPLALPTDRPRPPVYDPAGAIVTFTVEPQVARALTALGRQHGATPFMVLLAAFQALLARYCGQTDIAVGTPIAGRTRVEAEPLIGFFINTLVLRTQLAGDPSFVEVLARVRETALGAYAHQDVPFERLVDELQPQRDLSRNPLFQVMFALQNAAPTQFHLAGLEAQPLPIDWQTAKFDLSLGLAEQPDGSLAGMIEFATALFDPATAERLAGHYRQLLTSIAANPAARLSRLELLTRAERHQLLAQWNNTAEPRPEPCLHALFERQAAATPQATAVVFEAHTLSYAELNARANRLAHFLRAQGAGPESLVAVCLERSHEVVVALLAILKAGAAYVPLDPSYPRERLAFLLQDTGARVVLSEQRYADLLQGTHAQLVLLDRDRERVAAHPDHNPAGLTHPDHLAYVIYTSGSTGRPKGVLIEHRAYVHHCLAIAAAYEIQPSDRVVLLSALTFDVAMDQMAATLLAGATIVVSAPQFWSPAELPDKLAEYGVTIMEITPAYYRETLQAVTPGDPRLRRLKLMNVGSDVVTYDDARQWLATGLPGRFLCNYGPTEATVTCLLHPVDAAAAAAARPDACIPIGRPVAGTRAYILDDHFNPVPIGVPGELYLGGLRVARGYHQRPDLTAERFLPDPFAAQPGARLYRTGDLVRFLPEGTIEFLGRVDRQVKIRGFRIELGEIEAALSQHPAVRAAAIVAQEVRPGDKRLVGYVVPSGAPPAVSELRTFLGARLPEYMVPSLWRMLEALPLTPSGKVDRKALPLPEGARSALQGEYVAPRTYTEERIAALWCEVLKVDRVGAHDNFFEIGGHSLLATRVAVRLREAFDIHIPLIRLFEATTVAALASVVEAMLEEEIAQLSDDEVAALLAGEGEG